MALYSCYGYTASACPTYYCTKGNSTSDDPCAFSLEKPSFVLVFDGATTTNAPFGSALRPIADKCAAAASADKCAQVRRAPSLCRLCRWATGPQGPAGPPLGHRWATAVPPCRQRYLPRACRAPPGARSCHCRRPWRGRPACSTPPRLQHPAHAPRHHHCRLLVPQVGAVTVEPAVASAYRELNPATAKMFVATKGLQAVGANVTALLAAAASSGTGASSSTTTPTASTPATSTPGTSATPSATKVTDAGASSTPSAGSGGNTTRSGNSAGGLAAGLSGAVAALSAALLLL
jgi:hypothetical protein